MAQFKSGVFGKRMTADGATIGDVGNSDMKQKFKKVGINQRQTIGRQSDYK